MASPPAVAYRSTSEDRGPLRASWGSWSKRASGQNKSVSTDSSIETKAQALQHFFVDPASRYSRSELRPSYAKHFAMWRLQVAYKWIGKSISLLMSQSFAVTATLDIFFERR